MDSSTEDLQFSMDMNVPDSIEIMDAQIGVLSNQKLINQFATNEKEFSASLSTKEQLLVLKCMALDTSYKIQGKQAMLFLCACIYLATLSSKPKFDRSIKERRDRKRREFLVLAHMDTFMEKYLISDHELTCEISRIRQILIQVAKKETEKTASVLVGEELQGEKKIVIVIE
jgi:hypothetical protein